MLQKFKEWAKKIFFRAPEAKEAPVRLPGIPPKRGDYFKRMVQRFMGEWTDEPRKIKRRQRGLRRGLSKKEWENQNGKEWVAP